jgi:hypothetical protein
MTFHLRWFLVPLAVALLTISVPTGAVHAALILDQTTTPVPSAVVLFGVGVAALAGVTWRRHRRLAARAVANSHSCGVLPRHQL